MKSIKVISVVGARPNFMKVAPLHRSFEAHGAFDSKIVHTGQHYDELMSDIFFEELELPHPDHYLGVGSGSHAQMTASVMTAFEKVVNDENPDLVLVVGDVNSTLACSLVATKMHIPVAHVEAGLRSGDRRMPEEINRVVTDTLADFLFVTEREGIKNLRAEGVPDDKIFFVGNVMIDSLVSLRGEAAETEVISSLGLTYSDYAVMTMHRPSNVDNRDGITKIVEVIKRVVDRIPLVFPVHPRTRNQLEKTGYYENLSQLGNLKAVDPMGYVDFLRLMEKARFVITDSGGIQEETTFLQVPCLTLRDSTERPVTIREGTNELLPLSPDRVEERVSDILTGKRPSGKVPELWDGKASERIVDNLASKLI